MNNEKVLICLIANFVLFFFIGEVSHQLAPLGMSLQLDVIYIIFAGLYFRMLHGVIFVALIALFANAITPLPYGFHFITYLASWMFITWARPRIRRENPAHVKLLAILIQTLFFLVITSLMGRSLFGEFFFWMRVATDYSLNMLILLAFTHLWCEFQRSLMLSMGWDLTSEYQKV